MAVYTFAALAALWLLGLRTDAALSMATGTSAIVYLIGAGAALGLLAASGPEVIGPILFALTGLAWSLRRRPAPALPPARRPTPAGTLAA